MTIRGKYSILIVDDEFAIRDNLDQLLKSVGYNTVVAADGREALERAAEQEFDVVISDIRMPGMSGTEVLQRLLPSHPDTVVIMVTAVAELKTAVEAMKLGASDYVTKPFDLDDILVRVENAIEKRELKLLVRNHQHEIVDRLRQRENELRSLTAQTIQAVIREETLAGEARGKGKKPPASMDMKGIGAKILRRLSGDIS